MAWIWDVNCFEGGELLAKAAQWFSDSCRVTLKRALSLGCFLRSCHSLYLAGRLCKFQIQWHDSARPKLLHP